VGSDTTLVDANVLLDLLTEDPKWMGWSSAALTHAFDVGPVVINALVYAEVSIGFDSIEDLDASVPDSQFVREALPFEAGFLAGKAYRAYVRRGGSRTTPLPDFYIGAHAAISGHRLLTRDATRFRTYFPSLELVSP